MQKRLISMVLALSMALSAMPLPALAQSAPPDTASAAALAEENDDVTYIYVEEYSGKPVGDLFGGGNGSWSYDETSKTLTLKDGTFRLHNYSYSIYNNCIQWNVKIEPGATLQEARIGSEYHNGYTVTNAGTISGGTFYGKVICEAGAVISGGTFNRAVTVGAAGGAVAIDGGTFENKVSVNAVDTLTINGGTFKGGTNRAMDIMDAGAKVVINGGSFEGALKDHSTVAEITINSGLFKSILYGAAQNCTVNGGLFTAEEDPLPAGATVKGGYFTAERAGLVAIDATDVPVYLPVAVAADGTVTAWSADAYSTLYVTPNTSVTLKPTRKLKSVVSGGAELDNNAKDGAVSFTVGTEAVQLNSVTVEELVIEKDGFPKGTDGGVYGAKGNGWSFDPNHKHAEWHTSDTPVLTIEEGTELNLDEVENHSATVNFAIENNGTLAGTLNSTQYVYNKKTGTIKDATLNSLENRFYNDGRVENAVLRFYYIGNGWRDPAQPATIRNSALDITGWLLANMASNKAVLDGCYNSAGYTGTAVIGNGGTVKNSKSTLKLPVENTAGYDGNAKPYQPIIDGGEYTVVYNEGGIIQNDPTIHALVAKDKADLNGAADYYTLNYTAPEGAEYAKKYINGINGMIEGIWGAKVSTLYVACIDDTISVITHAPIKSVNGVAYNGSVSEGERYNSTIDLREYNIPQTHILNLSANGDGAAELPSADPADFTFALPTNPTYDGNPKMVEVIVRENATKKYGAVTVTYKQNGEVLDGAPVEPGTYTFTVTVAATATCAGGDVTPQNNKFSIQKAELKATDFNILVSYTTVSDGQSYTAYMNEQSPDSPLVLRYGDTITEYKIIPYADAAAKPASYTAAVMGDYAVLDDNGNKIGTGTGTPTEPGRYRLSIRVTADANHYAEPELWDENWVLDIWRAPLYISDFTVTEPDDLTYDGKPKEVTVQNNSDKDYGEITVTYQNDPYNSDGAVLDGAPVEPGVYYYTVKAAGGALYEGGLVASGSFRIKEADTPDPEPEKTYQLTVAGADITLPEDADADALKAGQLVSLTAYPDTATERFTQWVVSSSDGKELTLMDAADEPLTEEAFKQRTLTFRMPAQNLNITAMTTPVKPLPEEDSTKFSPLQTVAIVAGTTAWFAGSAVMGYEAVTYSILADLLPTGTPIPRTREQLAVLLWSTAGRPEPAAPAVYSDVAEPDTAKAARWAVEAGLLPDMGEGVFTPGKRVTKVQVIRAWNQLKKLGLAK